MNDLNIIYRHSSRAKHLRISIDTTETIKVTVPVYFSLKRAKEFAQSKEAWIYKQLAKIREKEGFQKELPDLLPEQLGQIKEKLMIRLRKFSSTHNLSYRKAAFRCQKTRWGSCSSRDNISLNINIAFLPEYLQNYVLLHELCHVRHKNHSKYFWTQLDEYCSGKAKTLAKELKKYDMKIRR